MSASPQVHDRVTRLLRSEAGAEGRLRDALAALDPQGHGFLPTPAVLEALRRAGLKDVVGQEALALVRWRFFVYRCCLLRLLSLRLI